MESPKKLYKRRRSRSKGRGDDFHLDTRRHSRSNKRITIKRAIGNDNYNSNAKDGHDQSQEGFKDSTLHKINTKKSRQVNSSLGDEDEGENQESRKSSLDDEDIERIREENHKRRQAILEKYKHQQQPPPPCEEHKDFEGNDMIHVVSPSGSDYGTHVNLTNGNYAHVMTKDNSLDSLMSNGVLCRPKVLAKGTRRNDQSSDIVYDYIFGESPTSSQESSQGDGVTLETSGLTDNWDDVEGYYCYRIGEILVGRYEVIASQGSGVFSSVVQARDTKACPKENDKVAIKIICSNEAIAKCEQQEIVILKMLAAADPDNKWHCIRFLGNFKYRNHPCLVFESLYKNLQEILKMFGRNIGIKLAAVQSYAKQLFLALKHLKNCGVLHCDIKPNNMLVNEAKNVLKLCDFGSAMFVGDNGITPYLVSRFYRAPEIILGLPYSHPLDMWSVGCCLYEFFTGKILFCGQTNNEMLKLHMELKGNFPKKLLKQALHMSKYFDKDYNLCIVEEDQVSKTNVKRVLVNVKQRSINCLLLGPVSAHEDVKMLGNFKDLLDKIFMLDPTKRLTISQALSHPFIKGK